MRVRRVRVLVARLRVPSAAVWHKKRSCKSSKCLFASRVVYGCLLFGALCMRRHTSEQRHGMLRSRPLLCVHVKGAGAVCGLRGRVCGLVAGADGLVAGADGFVQTSSDGSVRY